MQTLESFRKGEIQYALKKCYIKSIVSALRRAVPMVHAYRPLRGCNTARQHVHSAMVLCAHMLPTSRKLASTCGNGQKCNVYVQCYGMKPAASGKKRAQLALHQLRDSHWPQCRHVPQGVRITTDA